MRIRSLLVAGAFLSVSLIARADSYTTFDLNSSYILGGTIDGTLTLDTTSNLFSGADLTIAGFPPYQDGTLTDLITQGAVLGEYDVTIFSSGSPFADLNLFLPVNTLAGYDGSSIAFPTDVAFITFPNLYFAGSGTLDPASSCVAPEPGGLLLLATGLVGMAVFWRRRFAM